MPRSVAVYIAALGAVALVLLLDAGRHIAQHDWPYLVVLGLFTVFFRLHHLQVRQNVSVSLVSTVNLLSVLVAGGPAAIWVSALGNAAETLIKGRAPYQICYNISQSVISVFAAGSVFHLLGGRHGSEFAHPLAALAASAVYNLVNAALISRLFAFLRRRPFPVVLYRTLMGEETLYFATGQVVAILGAALVVSQPVMGLGLVFAVLVLAQYAFKAYLRMYHDASERQQELEAVFNATQSAILVRDGAGVVRHANRPLLEMAGLESAAGVVGQPYTHLDAEPHLAALLAAAAAAGPADTPSLRAVVPVDLGLIRHLDYYRGPVPGPGRDEGPAGTIEVFTDVTAVKAAEEKLRVVHASVLRAMTAAIDARDPYTHGHSTRVAEYSVRIARTLGLTDADIQRIHYSGLLHDIGKLGVDDRVLRKQGALTPEERAAMMEHPVIGAQLLEKAGVFLELLPGVRHHHEWYNGSGYPDGLKGEQIPYDARIIGVADAFDAMTSDRPYRPALSPQEALNRLNSGRSFQFDSGVVDAFTRIWQAGEVVVARLQVRLTRAAD